MMLNYEWFLLFIAFYPCLTRKALCAFRHRIQTVYMYIRLALNYQHIQERTIRIERSVISYLLITTQGIEYLKRAFPDYGPLQAIDTHNSQVIVGSGYTSADLYRWSRMSMASLAVDQAMKTIHHLTLFPKSILYNSLQQLADPEYPMGDVYGEVYYYSSLDLNARYSQKGKQPLRNVGLAIISNIDTMFNIYVWDIRGMSWSEKAMSSEMLIPKMPRFVSKTKSRYSAQAIMRNAIMFVQNEKDYSDFFFDKSQKNRDKSGNLHPIPYDSMVVIPYCFCGLKILSHIMRTSIGRINDYLLNCFTAYPCSFVPNDGPNSSLFPAVYNETPVFFGIIMDIKELIDAVCLGSSEFYILCCDFEVSYYKKILDCNEYYFTAPENALLYTSKKCALLHVDMINQPAKLLEHLKLLKPRDSSTKRLYSSAFRP